MCIPNSFSCSVEFVADAIIKLLEDDTNNGAVMKLSKANGVEFK